MGGSPAHCTTLPSAVGAVDPDVAIVTIALLHQAHVVPPYSVCVVPMNTNDVQAPEPNT